MTTIHGFSAAGRPSPWPPTCPACGWTGEYNDDQSPYLFCGGHKTRHRRTPVTIEHPPSLPTGAADPCPPDLGAGTVPLTSTPRSGQGRRAQTAGGTVPGARGRCRTCLTDFGLRAGTDGPVLLTHGPTGNRCAGTGWPPVAGTVTQRALAGAS